MLTRLLLGLGALVTFASAQSSSSSTGVSNSTISTGILSNATTSSSSGSFVANLTSSTGGFSNITSTGAFINVTSSTGIFNNITSSTGINNNLTSSSGSIIPPIGGSSGTASVTRCGGAGYDLSSIANMDLTLDDGDFVYAIRPCGTVSADLDLCDGQMCQDDTSISFYEPSLVNWYAIPNGVNLEVQNGDPSGCEGPRESDINFICNATQLTPRLVSVTEPTQCHYKAIVHTAAACTRNTTFQPGVGDAFTSTVCGGGAYDLSSINGADITARVGDYNWTVRVCGMVSNPLCASVQPVSICQQQDNTAWKLADYSHDLPLYEINSNGLNMSLESGEACGGLGNRTTQVQFVCDPTATTPVLTAENEYFTCEYWFSIRTSAVCGAPFQIRPVSSSSGLPQVGSSSSSGLPQVGSSSSGLSRSSSSSSMAPVLGSSSSMSPVLGSSSTGSLFPVDSSSSGPLFPIDSSSSTADENIEDPGVNGANMASMSSVAVVISLMAVAIAL